MAHGFGRGGVLIGLLVGLCSLGEGPAFAQTYRLETVASGLTQPLGVYAPPGDTSRIFIVQQTGQVRILDLGTGAISPGNFLDVSTLTNPGGEQGLLGLAFHPDYATNGYVFVNYTRSSDGATVVARYRASLPYATSGSVDGGAPVVLRTIAQPFANHNGGHLAFGPDGMLYVAVGDGGSAGDPGDRAQNTGQLLGKMLRLDVDNPASVYIPANNPFVGPGNPLDEIWALGLRNPWKFSFDRLTGDLWIGDVGQGLHEEIDFQPAVQLANPGDGNSTILNAATVAGRNYGWRCREGIAPYTTCSGTPPFVEPIHDVVHSNGVCSITGGVVYRGSAMPELQGAYFYADYCAGWIRSLRYDGVGVSDQVDWTSSLGTIPSIVAFGEDGSGELYVISIGGSVYRLVSVCGCSCELTPLDTLGYSDRFDSAGGWTTGSTAGVTDGQWERGVPVNDAAWAFDPTGDSADSGSNCYVTANRAGNSDVDGGTVYLYSPEIDLVNVGGGAGGGDVTICFEYYLNLNNTEGVDGIFVDVSSTGLLGPWRRVLDITAPGGESWLPGVITQGDLAAAGVTNSPTTRLRFGATDAGIASVVEAGIDDVRVYRRIPIVDCNANGIADATDISSGTSQDCNSNGVPDECDIALGVEEDFDGGPTGVRLAGDAFFNTSCVGCHGPNGTGDAGPNIRNKSRATIRNRLTLTIPHPGGGFPGATDQDFADLEAYLVDAGSRGRPDRVPDSCQTLPDCDGDTNNDGKELELGSQVDVDYDGAPDSCECSTPPTITAQPQGGRVDPGANVALTVSAGSGAPLTYQWRRGGSNLSDAGNVAGSSTSTLTLSSVTPADSGSYDVLVTNACGTSASAAAVVDVRCAADVDDGSGTGTPDGGVSVDDLIYFLGLFDAGAVGADIDDGTGTGTPDGGVTIDDLIYFRLRLDAGC